MNNQTVTNQTLGAELRRMREAMGLQPADIEIQLRIKAEYVLALENGAYEKLPSGNQGGAYGRGFLRSYAKFLGLEAELPRLLQLYAAEHVADDAPQLQMPKPLSEGKTADKKTMIGAVAAAIIVIIFWGALQNDPPAPIPPPAVELLPAPPPAGLNVEGGSTTSAAVPPLTALEQQVQPAPPVQSAQLAPQGLLQASPQESLSVPPLPVAPPPKLVVRAQRDSWVQITDATGATIFSRLLGQGEDYVVPVQAGLMLSTGNAGGLVLVKDGKAGEPLGALAEVKRNIQLTPKDSALKAPVND